MEALAEEFQEIQEVIKVVSPDWEGRVAAVKRIVELARSSEDSVAFCTSLATIQTCLSVQLKDLRSNVIKSMCQFLKQLGEILGSSFGAIVCSFYPQLEKNLCNRKELFYKSANITIQSLLRHTNSPELLSMILSSTGHKSSAIRNFSIQNIQFYLQNNKELENEEEADKIWSAVESSFSDTSVDVRSSCAALYWELKDLYPIQTEKIYNKLPTAKQDRVLRAKPSTGATTEKKEPKQSKSNRIPLRMRMAQQKRDETATSIEIVIPQKKVKKEERIIEPEVIGIVELKEQFAKTSWKEQEEIFRKYEFFWSSFTSSIMQTDLIQYSTLYSLQLFTDSHPKVLESSLASLLAFIRCLSASDVQYVLSSNLNPGTVNGSTLIANRWTKSYSLLGAIFWSSRSSSPAINGIAHSIHNVIIEKLSDTSLCNACITTFSKVIANIPQNENELKRIAPLIKAAMNFFAQIISNSKKKFLNEPLYVRLMELSLSLSDSFPFEGIRASIRDVIVLLYTTDTIQFSTQYHCHSHLSRVNASLPSTFSIFSKEQCSCFLTFIAATPNCVPGLGDTELNIYSFENIQDLLQQGVASLDDSAILASVWLLASSDNSSQWFYYYPLFVELLNRILRGMTQEEGETRYQQIPTCFYILLSIRHLISKMPNQLTTQIIPENTLQALKENLLVIQTRFSIQNTSELASLLLHDLQIIEHGPVAVAN